MTSHDMNTHEAPLLDPEARFSPHERFELDDTDQNAPNSALPSHRNTISNPRQWWTSLGGHFKGWQVIVFDWFNVLLVMIPVAWTFSLKEKNASAPVLVFSLLALMPLVKLHDLATHELALRIGGFKTGLLNASLSNIVATVISIIALVKCELRIVQSTLIGMILGKLLLVLGLCFFAGGIRFYEQGFDATATQLNSTLLSISVGALLLPAIYHFSISGSTDEVAPDEKQHILQMSRGISIILLVTYVAYLVFQLFSHTHLYHDRHDRQAVRFSLKAREKTLTSSSSETHQRIPSSDSITLRDGRRDDMTLPRGPFVLSRRFSTTSAAASRRTSISSRHDAIDSRRFNSNMSESYHTAFEAPSDMTLRANEEQERTNDIQDTGTATTKEPRLSWFLTIFLLFAVTGAASFTAEILVVAMDAMHTVISKEWVALILLPAVTSLAESMTAVNVSVKDRLTLSISIAVGGALQTALLIIPFIVTLSWMMGKPLSLLMDPFQTLVLYISVQTMSHTIADGKSNWLEGLILIFLYVVIAVSFWFYPGSNLPVSIGTCT